MNSVCASCDYLSHLADNARGLSPIHSSQSLAPIRDTFLMFKKKDLTWQGQIRGLSTSTGMDFIFHCNDVTELLYVGRNLPVFTIVIKDLWWAWVQLSVHESIIIIRGCITVVRWTNPVRLKRVCMKNACSRSEFSLPTAIYGNKCVCGGITVHCSNNGPGVLPNSLMVTSLWGW